MPNPENQKEFQPASRKEILLRWAFYHFLCRTLGFKVDVDELSKDQKLPDHALFAGYPHRSHLDTVAIQLALGTPEYGHQSVIVKGEYWSGWRRNLLKQIFPESRILPVDKEDSAGLRQLVGLLKERKMYSEKEWVIIYPQGTRDDGAAAAQGTAFLARMSGFEIVPVVLKWEADVLSKSKNYPQAIMEGVWATLRGKRRKVRVHFGQPISTEGKQKEQIHQELMSYYQEHQLVNADDVVLPDESDQPQQDASQAQDEPRHSFRPGRGLPNQ